MEKVPLLFRAFLRVQSAALNASLRPNMTVNRFVMNLFDPKISPSPKPNDGVSTHDVVVDSTRNLWFRLFVPSLDSDDATPLPLLVYFHGGGFAFLSANSLPYVDHCRRLARELRLVVVSVNYRLSPEHKYPVPYDDGFDALKFIDEKGFDSDVCPTKVDFEQCFIAGDSAGGNLAHHIAVRAGRYDFKKLKIKGLIAIQPFFGGEERVESEIRYGESSMLNLQQADWYWKAFLPDGSNRNHPAAHVFGPDAEDISGVQFPATLLIVGGQDQLQGWQQRYYEWLKEAGKEVELFEFPDAFHGFYLVPGMQDETSLLIKHVREFILKCMSVN